MVFNYLAPQPSVTKCLHPTRSYMAYRRHEHTGGYQFAVPTFRHSSSSTRDPTQTCRVYICFQYHTAVARNLRSLGGENTLACFALCELVPRGMNLDTSHPLIKRFDAFKFSLSALNVHRYTCVTLIHDRTTPSTPFSLSSLGVGHSYPTYTSSCSYQTSLHISRFTN